MKYEVPFILYVAGEKFICYSLYITHITKNNNLWEMEYEESKYFYCNNFFINLDYDF